MRHPTSALADRYVRGLLAADAAAWRAAEADEQFTGITGTIDAVEAAFAATQTANVTAEVVYAAGKTIRQGRPPWLQCLEGVVAANSRFASVTINNDLLQEVLIALGSPARCRPYQEPSA